MVVNTHSALGFSQTIMNKASETLHVLLSLSAVGDLERGICFEKNKATGYHTVNTSFHTRSGGEQTYISP